MGQKYAAYDPATGAITTYYDDIDRPAPEGVATLAITDAEWQACLLSQSMQGLLYTVVNGALVAPTVTAIAAQATASAAQTARDKRNALLAIADNIYNTAADAGAPTMAIMAYRAALRAVPEQAGFPATITWPVLDASVTVSAADRAAMATLGTS